MIVEHFYDVLLKKKLLKSELINVWPFILLRNIAADVAANPSQFCFAFAMLLF